MKKFSMIISLAALMMSGSVLAQSQAAQSLDDLLAETRKAAQQQNQINGEVEAEFVNQRNQGLLRIALSHQIALELWVFECEQILKLLLLIRVGLLIAAFQIAR